MLPHDPSKEDEMVPETATSTASGSKKKRATIIVNGREFETDAREISFIEVLALAFDPVPSGPNIEITMTYKKGPDQKPKGTLVAGQSVKVKDGMIFNVTVTDKS